MSETRPPITAGPIERAFRFLKSTSVSCTGVDEGVEAGPDNGGVVLAGDAVANAALCGEGEGSSCAGRRSTIENKKAQKHRSRVIMARATMAFYRCRASASLAETNTRPAGRLPCDSLFFAMREIVVTL